MGKIHFHQLIIFLIIFQSIDCYLNTEVNRGINIVQHADNFNILNGGRAQRNQFPYQVSLRQYSEEKNYYYHVCSGAVISDKWVISTAYCVFPDEKPLQIVAGSLVKYEIHPDVQVIDVESVIMHPDYKRETFENDIALLELVTYLVFSQSILPIHIDLSPETRGLAILSGWNVQTQLLKQFSLDTLQYMIVYVMTDMDCKKALQDSSNSSRNMLCSKATMDEFYCPGESGSPLVHGGYLIGITSWGLKPCGTTVYTKVVSFVEFIRMYVNV